MHPSTMDWMKKRRRRGNILVALAAGLCVLVVLIGLLHQPSKHAFPPQRPGVEMPNPKTTPPETSGPVSTQGSSALRSMPGNQESPPLPNPLPNDKPADRELAV